MTSYDLELRDEEPLNAAVVELSGELDLTNVLDVERRLEEIGGRKESLLLDLNRITFVDSAALHMLFRLARRFDGQKRFGIILEPTALIARTLTIVGLDEVASVRATIEELAGEPST